MKRKVKEKLHDIWISTCAILICIGTPLIIATGIYFGCKYYDNAHLPQGNVTIISADNKEEFNGRISIDLDENNRIFVTIYKGD